jgi:Inhibitor of Apoptosis domain
MSTALEPLLKWESVRALTFNETWRKNNNFLTVDDLAKAGFFYVHVDDYVQCFSCRVQLGSWIPGDVPEIEHRKWRPDCPYMLNLPAGNISAATQKRWNVKLDLPDNLQFKQLAKKKSVEIKTPEIRHQAEPERGWGYVSLRRRMMTPLCNQYGCEFLQPPPTPTKLLKTALESPVDGCNESIYSPSKRRLFYAKST